MSLASFFANKCFEYLLTADNDVPEQSEQDHGQLKNKIFPPWAVEPVSFKEKCTGCGECAIACTEQLITIKEDGLPEIDFSNGFCTFCGDCAQSCPVEALQFSDQIQPWDLHVTISDNCLMRKNVLCQICQEQCDQEALIYTQVGQNMQSPEILNNQCNGCGACFARCPADAISFQQIDARQSEAVQRGDE